MPQVLEKTERRLGERLSLKGDRCVGPKCALIRRGYPPGAHGKNRRKRRGSEFGELLRGKQKVRYLYGLDDKDMERYSREAVARPGVFSSNFVRLIERRLDNVVFRLGFAVSRRTARQLVSHGHIMVKGRVVRAPSYRVEKGDKVAIKEHTRTSALFLDLETRLKNYDPPGWLSLETQKREGIVRELPPDESADTLSDIAKIKEFYSR